MPTKYFSWLRYAKSVLTQVVVIGLLVLYRFKLSGKFDTSSQAVVVAFTWINLVTAFRWRQLRNLETSGEVTAEKYRANPFIATSPAHWFLMVGGGAALVMVLVLLEA